MKPLNQLGREDLYALVWGEAMATLAPKLGISDVGLKKRCKGLGIPTPPRGYWAKLEAGKKVKKVPLPESWSIPTRKKRRPSSREAVNRFQPEASYESSSLRGIAAKTYQGLLKQRSFGALIEVQGEGILRTAVSRDHILRASALWQLLLTALAERNVVRIADGTFTDSVEILEIKLIETQVRIERPFNPAIDRDPWKENPKTVKEDVPSGFLAFRVREPGSYSTSTDWKDSPQSPLDGKIDQVADAIVRKMESLHAKHLEQEKVRQRREHEWQERQRVQAEARKEAERRDALLVVAKELDDASSIRRLIDRLATSAHGDDGVKGFLEWASQVADELDPTNTLIKGGFKL